MFRHLSLINSGSIYNQVRRIYIAPQTGFIWRVWLDVNFAYHPFQMDYSSFTINTEVNLTMFLSSPNAGVHQYDNNREQFNRNTMWLLQHLSYLQITAIVILCTSYYTVCLGVRNYVIFLFSYLVLMMVQCDNNVLPWALNIAIKMILSRST